MSTLSETMTMSTVTDVIVPCQYDLDGLACEADVAVQVVCDPGERETWDYPGTPVSWDVVEWGVCCHGHECGGQALEDLKMRAIHAAQEGR